MHDANIELKPSSCITAAETRQAYLDLVASGLCGPDSACLRDTCPACLPLNLLIDQRGAECDARGCTLARCVFESGGVLVA